MTHTIEADISLNHILIKPSPLLPRSRHLGTMMDHALKGLVIANLKGPLTHKFFERAREVQFLREQQHPFLWRMP